MTDSAHPEAPAASEDAPTQHEVPRDDVKMVEELHRAVEQAKDGIGHRIIGQREVVEHLLIARPSPPR